MLSGEFKPARWRGTTNTDGESIGVSFDMAGGEVVRLKLDVVSARHLSETLREYLDAHCRCETATEPHQEAM